VYRCICRAEHFGAACEFGETIFTETFASYPTALPFASAGLYYTTDSNCAVLSNLATDSYVINQVTSFIGAVGRYDMAPTDSFFIMDTTTSGRTVVMTWTVDLGGQYDMVGLRVTAAANEADDKLPLDPANNVCLVSASNC